MTQKTEQNQRLEWVDAIKLVAIFMLLACHCTDNVTPAQRSEDWYVLWGSLFGSLLRPVIPLFVMVTGVLLLPVRESMTGFYRRRIGRVVVPFLVWSVFYNLFPWFTGLLGLEPTIINDFFAWARPSQELGDALGNVAMVPFDFSAFAVQMWYVFVLVGLYLYLPVFSAWVRDASKRDMQIFLGIWTVALFIPYLREFLVGGRHLWGECSWNEFGMLYYFTGFNGYLLLGHYLVKHPVQWSTVKLWAVCVPMFAVGYLSTYFGFSTLVAVPGQSESMVELFYTYCSPNVMLMSVPIFLLMQRIRVHSPLVKTLLKSASVCAFGIWMSHYLFLGPVFDLVEMLGLHTMVSLVVSSVLLLIVDWAFVALVLKIKNVGRWIMG